MANNKSIQLLRGTSEQRLASTEQLLPGQPFYEVDTKKLYVGGNPSSPAGQTLLQNAEAICASTADALKGLSVGDANYKNTPYYIGGNGGSYVDGSIVDSNFDGDDTSLVIASSAGYTFKGYQAPGQACVGNTKISSSNSDGVTTTLLYNDDSLTIQAKRTLTLKAHENTYTLPAASGEIALTTDLPPTIRMIIGTSISNYTEATTSFNKIVLPKASVGDYVVATNPVTDCQYLYQVTKVTLTSATVQHKYTFNFTDDLRVVDNKIQMGPGAQATNNYTMAAGVNASASGSGSFALGPNTKATSTDSVALGANALAYSTNSTALGANTLAEGGSYTVAVGSNAQAVGDQCVAIGHNTRTDGTRSLSLGVSSGSGNRTYAWNSSYDSLAIGSGAQVDNCGPGIAIGCDVKATGNSSGQQSQCAIAMGWGSQASSSNTIAIGHDAMATADGSIAIGQGAVAMAANQLVIGNSSIKNITMGGLISVYSRGWRIGGCWYNGDSPFFDVDGAGIRSCYLSGSSSSIKSKLSISGTILLNGFSFTNSAIDAFWNKLSEASSFELKPLTTNLNDDNYLTIGTNTYSLAFGACYHRGSTYYLYLLKII